ncbi:50S ribosomal protein L24, partial [Candidatus Dependentiae bacterium]|nr:50S ribosomal protein L24 [Candidatus Dependentiae bacterium]
MLSRIKKNDSVVVLSGKDKGKQGLVISVDLKDGVALIKDVSVVTRHVKARKAGEKSRIVKEERPIMLCKIMPICPSCKKPCRVQVRFHEGSEKARMCSRCKET